MSPKKKVVSSFDEVKMLKWVYGSFLNFVRSLFWKQEIELTLVGLQNSGKTTLVNVFANGEFVEDNIPTVGFNMRRVQKNNVSIKLWDIGGQQRFRAMWDRYCRSVSAIVYVIDAADPSKLEMTKQELHILVTKPTLEAIPLLILGNKNDLPNHMGVEELREKLEVDSFENRVVEIYSVSAKTHNNIDLTLDWLVKHSKKKKTDAEG